MALLDYSRAFELVKHQILLTKLKSLAVKDSALQWFRSYLKTCRQCVAYKNKPNLPIHINTDDSQIYIHYRPNDLEIAGTYTQ